MLRRLADDLWVTERSLRFGGLEIGSRMTIVRLASGALFLHSPVALDAELRSALEALGRPRYAVAPNRFHHLSIGDTRDAWPDLEIYVAPGLDTKRPDLPITAVLDDSAPEGWAGELEQLAFQGFPLANEIVFFHAKTATLILTDLAFHIGEESPTLTRFLFRMMGAYGSLGPSLLERLLIRDREKARASLDRILAWPFERVIVSHGAVSETGGRASLEKGYAWL